MTNPKGFLVVFIVPFSVILGYLIGGGFTFLTPILIFGVVPLLDLAFGGNTRNPSPAEEAAIENAAVYKNIVMACAPLQVFMVIWGAFAVTHGHLSLLEKIGFVLSVGSCSGIIGINAAHELTHRIHEKGGIEPLLGKIMLMTVLYMHWAVEHVMGHHKNVATPQDPATARLGESFWAFFPRSVAGGFKDSWALETARLERKHAPAKGPENRILRYLAAEVLFLGVMAALFGFGGLVFVALQGLVAVWLLEIVNYVEHYGMRRKAMPDGSFEAVKPVHSWNSSNWFSNYFLFNLERHSDHHWKPRRRYQILRHFDESPQLPTGYAGMILLAAAPPLWRRYMDERVAAHLSASGNS